MEASCLCQTDLHLPGKSRMFNFFFFFLPCSTVCRILAPQPGIQPWPPGESARLGPTLDHLGIPCLILVEILSNSRVSKSLWLLRTKVLNESNSPLLLLLFVLLSCVQLFPTPWTVARRPPPLSMGFSRQEYWSGLPFPPPGDLTQPGIELASPAWQGNSLPLGHQGSPRNPERELLRYYSYIVGEISGRDVTC